MRVGFGYPTADEEYDVLARRVERRREEIVLDPVTDAAGRAGHAGGGGAVRLDESVGPLLRRAGRSHARRTGRC